MTATGDKIDEVPPEGEGEPSKPENWVDIKGLLDEVSEVLTLGDLVHGDSFHLGDAMCCLEVMHPKMDSGMTKEEKVTLDGLIAAGTLPKDDKLSLTELIGVFDQILCCEMTYYQGQPVPQTVFTCLYMHRPLALASLVVRAFVVASLKTCHLVRRVVQKVDVFEEEDFVVQMFDFGFCDELVDTEALKLIKEAEESVNSAAATASEEEKPLYDALLARIKFRKHLYMAHIYLDKYSEKNFELAKKALVAAQVELEKLKSSAQLGKLPEGVFDARVTRHIMSSSPPRTTAIISQEKALQLFADQLKHIQIVCNFIQVEPSYTAINEFYLEFSYLIPGVVARSRLHACFLQNKKIMGVLTSLEFAVDTMKRMGVPIHFFDKLESKEKESVKNFAERLGSVLNVYFKNLLHNRSRLRRKITLVLGDFTILQQEGDDLDEERARAEGATEREPGAFGVFVLECKLRLMVLWLNLGFELEMYQKEECFLIYWYLDYLLAVNVQNQSYLLELNRKESVDKNKKGKKDKKLVQQHLKQTQAFAATFFIPHHLLAAMSYLTKGMLKFLGALRKLGYIPDKDFPYGDSEVRFLKRFAIFHKMQYQPQPLFYHHYTDILSREYATTTTEKLLQAAVEHFQQAKTYLEKVVHSQNPAPNPSVTAEVKTLLRVAISNTLQCQMLLKNTAQVNGTNNNVSLQFSTHHYYPIVSITK